MQEAQGQKSAKAVGPPPTRLLYRSGFFYRGGKADDTSAVVAWSVSLDTWRRLAKVRRELAFHRGIQEANAGLTSTEEGRPDSPLPPEVS